MFIWCLNRIGLLRHPLNHLLTPADRIFKDKYDGRKARVDKVLSKKLRVVLLDGAAKGESSDFVVENIEKLTSVGNSASAHAAEGADTTQEPAMKKQKTSVADGGEAEAESLFGKLEV